ncbi:small ribosomal subunit protein mS29-like isoform X2 [Apostichopus japonicus]|uniref:small ribosomal subunit protein mS29-like isoform X2 n=1 Tax=Stichopus japonicus TaxID=307972 RepID=UPI003AB3B358
MAAPLMKQVPSVCRGAGHIHLLHSCKNLFSGGMFSCSRLARIIALQGRTVHLHAANRFPLADDLTVTKDHRSEYFRTSETNPLNHTLQHEGLFYTIPQDEVKRVFPVGYSTRWERLIKPFNEAAVMVRRPAVEIIQLIKHTNFDHLALKYVVFGRKGSGKTMTLNHVIHYCHNAGWLIAHVHSANNLNLKNKYDFIDSSSHEGMYDQPITSTDWLKQFKLRNEAFLKQLKTSERYVWNKREATDKDEPLIAVLEQGITRPKNATDVVGVILRELRLHSFNKEFKMLFAIKAMNGLFAHETAFRKTGGYIIPVEELTLHMHFKKFLEGNWINGSIVTSVDQQFCYKQPNKEYTPFYLLGKKGFDHMDPFIPVFVDNYSEKEFESQMAYYDSKSWIQNENVLTDEGKLYLKKLSERNPAELDRLIAWM